MRTNVWQFFKQKFSGKIPQAIQKKFIDKICFQTVPITFPTPGKILLSDSGTPLTATTPWWII